MVELRSLKVDLDAASNGRWVTFVPGLKLLVARYLHPKHRDAIHKLYADWHAEHGTQDVPGSVNAEITRKSIAEAILLGWEGLEDDGEQVPFSVEKATEIMLDPEMVDLQDFVCECSQADAAYRKGQTEKDLGN